MAENYTENEIEEIRKRLLKLSDNIRQMSYDISDIPQREDFEYIMLDIEMLINIHARMHALKLKSEGK